MTFEMFRQYVLEEFTMAAQPVLVFASFEPKPGREGTVENILRGMVAPTRNEPGNEIYGLYERKDGPEGKRSFHLFEKYTDASALEFHRETEHYKNYRATIVEHLSEPIGVVVLKALDTCEGA
jgi:quinol monooxygenase YgiN